MKYCYIRHNSFVTFGFELDARYNLGYTFADSMDGKYVRLNDPQLRFKREHPSASVREVWEMRSDAPHSPDIEEVRRGKIYEIQRYDNSPAVNSFTLNGQSVWLDKDTRVGLMNSISIEKASGRESTTLWLGGVSMVIDCDTAIGVLSALELYALACYNRTAEHKAVVSSLATMEEVQAYDYTTGYPDKLIFNT